MKNKLVFPPGAGSTGHFPIVAIGAAEGGLLALETMLGHLSPDTGMAFVFIHHPGKEYSGVLPSIFAGFTKMRVLEARHQMLLEPNSVYILPLNTGVKVIDGLFFLNTDNELSEQQVPIDGFFRSLADSYKEGIIGVLLSGRGSDGTAGLKAVKIAGGIAFAQDESAQSGHMPRSAIGEGIVDFVLSPAGIAQELETIRRQSNTFSEKQVNDNFVTIKRHKAEVSIFHPHLLNNATRFFGDGDAIKSDFSSGMAEQLTESKDFAEAIFETIREAVVVLGKDFRIRMANASFYKTFAVRPEETEGISIYELGEVQWTMSKIRALLNDLLEHDAHFNGYELQCPINGIGNRTMLLNGRKVVQKANKQELMLLAFEDVTDRRIAEKMTAERDEWFRNMANNAPVMIWTAGPDGMRTFFNVTWLTFTGRRIEQEIGDGWISDLFAGDVDEFLSLYNAAFERKEPFNIHYRLRRADGEFRWVQAIGKPTFSTEGQFTGLVGICAEVHDSKLLQEELERQVNQRTLDLQEVNRNLKRSNTELQQFAYIASHDLQEPLRKILMFSDRLKSRNDLPDEIMSQLGKIAGSAQRMSRLIHDVLDFSGAVKDNHQFVPTDLNKILEAALQDFDVAIGKKNALIAADNLPVIDAIPLQMGQLFHNLLSNALKFSKPMVNPVITITASRPEPGAEPETAGLDGGTEYVEIVFEDNGIGFSNEFAEQIFVIFQRLHARHEYLGTGIGLALCRKIVDNHGGIIYSRSIEQVRTAFHIILPVLQSSKEVQLNS